MTPKPKIETFHAPITSPAKLKAASRVAIKDISDPDPPKLPPMRSVPQAGSQDKATPQSNRKRSKVVGYKAGTDKGNMTAEGSPEKSGRKKRQSQRTYQVEHISGIRRAHDYTPQNNQFQYAVKWVGYDNRSWHSPETLNNYPLLVEQLSRAIDEGFMYIFPQQKISEGADARESEGEGAEVDESLMEESGMDLDISCVRE